MAVWLLLGMSTVATGQSSADAARQYRLKVAFLYNFAVFSEWPSDVGPTVTVCVSDSHAFGGEFDALRGREVGQRRAEVRHVDAKDPLADCQILFLDDSNIEQLGQILERLGRRSVLTVADSAGAVKRGVMLSMSVVDNRIVFDANVRAARAARIVLSSKLLRLAGEVLQ